MLAREVIIRPIITEKSMRLNEMDNKVTFEVAQGTNKTQIAMAIEEIYGIKPLKVNVSNNHPKKRRVGRYVGVRNRVRKAIVKLPEGTDIALFEEI